MADKTAYKCLLISDFTIDNLAGFINNSDESPAVKSLVAPFNQVVQVLSDHTMECWKDNPQLSVIWTKPEKAVPLFSKVLSFEQVNTDELLKEVDRFASLILNTASNQRTVIVCSWTLPLYYRGTGLLEMDHQSGVYYKLLQMNLRLTEKLQQADNVFLLNSERWIAQAGKEAGTPKLWYLGKILFAPEVFRLAAEDIKAALRGINGLARKLVIVDLDNTLWGGVVGEDGYENLALGGHDHIGEAFTDFQAALKSLTNRGIVLGIVSKNTENIAMEAINKHPEMVLKETDFVGWRINWEDKAQNIAALVSELNLGLDAAVFIDDSVIERSRVKDALPDVLVPEWPEDPMLYTSTLLSLRCFDNISISEEDSRRTQMYISDKKRKGLIKKVNSIETWLNSLKTKVTVEEQNSVNMPRILQLLNKTNQMNMSTRRLSEAELKEWASSENHRIWGFRVSDTFGDSGLCGILSIENSGDGIARIVDFVLSCRVMGRKVEETMLFAAYEFAKSANAQTIIARHISTPRNAPCLDFFNNSVFSFIQEKKHFALDVGTKVVLPACIELSGIHS